MGDEDKRSSERIGACSIGHQVAWSLSPLAEATDLRTMYAS